MELIVEDAVIVTMAPGAGPADAMLIRNGRIAAVGQAETVRAAAPGAEMVRLGGATVIPGLIDAHCHVADIGYLAAAADCGQPSAPDIAAIQARLRQAAERTPDGAWVTGAGYAEYKLREGRHPTRAELDEAVPNRPAVLYHTSLHVCVLNTAALREAGFADGQPDPPGGAFGRDSEGGLDGVVYEAPMFALFERNIRRDITQAGTAGARIIQTAGERLAGFGLTSACDADMRRDTFAAFAEADAAGRLRQRIYGLVVHDQVDWLLRRRAARPSFRPAGHRGREDLGRRRDEQPHRGHPRDLPGAAARLGHLVLRARRADRDGPRLRRPRLPGLHPCPGRPRHRDRPGRLRRCAVFGLSSGLSAGAGNPRRHRIEHGGAMYPPLAARAAALGIVVASQPGFLSSLGDGFAAAFPDSGDQLYSFASWQRAGITVAGSSDAPVITADPRIGIRDAIARRTGDGRVLGPAERLAARDALALYTTQAAYACHRESEIGSLEPGKLADFVVLDQNPLETDAALIPDIGVLATVLGGTPVYQSGSIFPGR